jgi:hypothetical protein
MKTVTIKRIPFGPYIRWSAIVYSIYGVCSGLFESLYAYYTTGGDPGRLLFLYGVRIAALYMVVGLCAGSVFIFIYNSFVGSIGGYRFEINFDEEKIEGPPPPPNNFD